MKVNKCKLLGHKWTPLFIKGEYNGTQKMFIACFCQRCNKGYDEAVEINDIALNREFGTYNEKYFDREKINQETENKMLLRKKND